MPTRRHLLTACAALGAAALPAFAQDRPNPMPEELRKALERSPNSLLFGR